MKLKIKRFRAPRLRKKSKARDTKNGSAQDWGDDNINETKKHPVFLVPMLDKDDEENVPSWAEIPNTPPTPYTQPAMSESFSSDADEDADDELSFKEREQDDKEEDDITNEDSKKRSVTRSSSLDFPDLLIDDSRAEEIELQQNIRYRPSKAVEVVFELESSIPDEPAFKTSDEETEGINSVNNQMAMKEEEETSLEIELPPEQPKSMNLNDKISASLKAISAFKKKTLKGEKGRLNRTVEEELERDPTKQSESKERETEPMTSDDKESKETATTPGKLALLVNALDLTLKRMEEENKKLENEKAELAIRKMKQEQQEWKEPEGRARPVDAKYKPHADIEWRPRHNDQSMVLYSFVARDGMIVADSFSGRVVNSYRCEILEQLGQDLTDLNPIPGWYQSSFRRDDLQKTLRGIKFNMDDVNIEGTHVSWDFGCIWDPATDLERIQVQSFIDKIVCISEVFRENEYDWQYGSYSSVQPTFGPILSQRMEEISYMGKRAMVGSEIFHHRE